MNSNTAAAEGDTLQGVQSRHEYGRTFRRFPNGKTWPVDDWGLVTALVKVADAGAMDGESLLDALSDAITGSTAGLVGINVIERGNDLFEVCAGIDIDGIGIDDASGSSTSDCLHGLPAVYDSDELASSFITQFGLSQVEARHAVDNLTTRFDSECIRPILGTMRDLHAPSHPLPCDYVRIVVCGIQIAYWISDEWRDDPEHVMGAVIGALHGK